MKEFITVAEASKELNISKQAVYQRLEKDLKPYCKTLNGQKVIQAKAIKSIAADKPEQLQDEINKLKQETIEALKETIEILKQQQDISNKQIAEQQEAINKLIQLQHNNQVLMLEKKPSLFKRLFHRKENDLND